MPLELIKINGLQTRFRKAFTKSRGVRAGFCASVDRYLQGVGGWEDEVDAETFGCGDDLEAPLMGRCDRFGDGEAEAAAGGLGGLGEAAEGEVGGPWVEALAVIGDAEAEASVFAQGSDCHGREIGAAMLDRVVREIGERLAEHGGIAFHGAESQRDVGGHADALGRCGRNRRCPILEMRGDVEAFVEGLRADRFSPFEGEGFLREIRGFLGGDEKVARTALGLGPGGARWTASASDKTPRRWVCGFDGPHWRPNRPGRTCFERSE